MNRLAWMPALLLLFGGTGCEFPLDANGTLNRVRAERVLRVGVSERLPWVAIDRGTISGIDADLTRDWAATLGAEVQWMEATEAALVRALEGRQIDLVVAGLTSLSPWKERAAPTQPCTPSAVVVAVPAGVLVPRSDADVAGRTIFHSAKRPDFAALIAAKDAKPVATDDLRADMAAVYAFEAARLGLVASGIVLAREKRVMLVAPGESAFLLELDRFLSLACRAAMLNEPTDEAGQTT